MDHLGKRLFITGIPTSGKSYLAKLLSEKTGGIYVNLDEVRDSLSADQTYSKWVNFYEDLGEYEYLTNTSDETKQNDLIAQSEALWPALLQEISKYGGETRPVIFECVNILPHLAKKDLTFEGVVLLGTSYEEILARNILEPRWGDTEELIELEAKTFFEVERPFYKKEADKYGYITFERADDAISYCIEALS